jgi:hypothetical protein
VISQWKDNYLWTSGPLLNSSLTAPRSWTSPTSKATKSDFFKLGVVATTSNPIT